VKKTFGIRIDDDVLKSLSLSSHLTHTPVSKLITPFIEEGSRIILGSLLLLMVDREAVIDRRAVEELIGEVLGGPEEELRSPPMIVRRMEEIMGRREMVKDMEKTFPGVSFSPTKSVSLKGDLKSLLLGMGGEYLRRGGSLKKLQIDLGMRVFMENFLRIYYRKSARGTLEELKEAWMIGERALQDLAEKIYVIYASEVKLTPIEAIEIGEFRK